MQTGTRSSKPASSVIQGDLEFISGLESEIEHLIEFRNQLAASRHLGPINLERNETPIYNDGSRRRAGGRRG